MDTSPPPNTKPEQYKNINSSRPINIPKCCAVCGNVVHHCKCNSR